MLYKDSSSVQKFTNKSFLYENIWKKSQDSKNKKITNIVMYNLYSQNNVMYNLYSQNIVMYNLESKNNVVHNQESKNNVVYSLES